MRAGGCSGWRPGSWAGRPPVSPGCAEPAAPPAGCQSGPPDRPTGGPGSPPGAGPWSTPAGAARSSRPLWPGSAGAGSPLLSVPASLLDGWRGLCRREPDFLRSAPGPPPDPAPSGKSHDSSLPYDQTGRGRIAPPAGAGLPPSVGCRTAEGPPQSVWPGRWSLTPG